MSAENAAVNFSELVNKNKQTLARLQEAPRPLLHRRDGEDLVLTTAARGAGAVPVRDSKAPQGPALLFPAGGWSSFVAAVRTRDLPGA